MLAVCLAVSLGCAAFLKAQEAAETTATEAIIALSEEDLPAEPPAETSYDPSMLYYSGAGATGAEAETGPESSTDPNATSATSFEDENSAADGADSASSSKEDSAPGEYVIEEGEKTGISLDLRGIDITEFFKVLSKNLDINIIPSKSVAGRINLFLNNINYEDALEVVILSQGLAYEKKGDNIMMVMTAAEYKTLYGEEFNDKKDFVTVKLESAQPKLVFNALGNLSSSVGKIIVDEATGTILLIDTPEKLELMLSVIRDLDAPVATEIFELQYAKAADVKANVTSLVTSGAGSVLTDERSNTLIVSDLPGNMNRIKQAIILLDQETKQIFLEVEILEITLEDQLQSGVNWNQIMSNNFYDWLLAGSFQTALGATLVGTFTSRSPKGIDIEFLNTIANTRILSRPRLAVTNNEEATLLVGTREAYVTGTTSQSGDSTITSDTVEFVDVGVKLTVVPTINRDRFITMKIKPEISSVARTLTTGDEDAPRSQIPIVTTSEAETTVKVKDGATIMIAGLRQNSDALDIDGLPYMSRIPFMDFFFTRRDHDKDQTEIIIFITPYIIRGDQMRSWDVKHMKKFPSQASPEGKKYTYPMLTNDTLKEVPAN